MGLSLRHQREDTNTPHAGRRNAVGAATEMLAARSPERAVAVLVRPQPNEVSEDLLPRIAHGLGTSAEGRGERALLSTPPELLLRLVIADGTADRPSGS